MPMPIVVTFDLFSALLDSRTGGALTFDAIAARRGWSWSGAEIYDAWDSRNKRLQAVSRPSDTFHDIAGHALGAAYSALGAAPDHVDADLSALEASMAEWPLWPDVAGELPLVADLAAVGILSNVDDGLARSTAAHTLIDRRLLLTSQRLGAYKPNAAIYRAARRLVAPRHLIHVAASARDTRGALESGTDTVRIARPGHAVDAAGPRPTREITTIGQLVPIVRRSAGLE